MYPSEARELQQAIDQERAFRNACGLRRVGDEISERFGNSFEGAGKTRIIEREVKE